MAKNNPQRLLDIWARRVSLWNSKKKKTGFETWFLNFQFPRMRVTGNDHERSTGKELKRVVTDKCSGAKRPMN